jgi:hypothetical protein
MQEQPKPGGQSYDFIFANQPKAGRKIMPELPRPVLIIGAVLVLIILLIVFGSLLGKQKSKTTGLSDVLGQAQEITRVSQMEEAKLQDPALLSLLNTTDLTLTSDQTALSKYMSAHKYTVDKTKVSSYKNSQTDSAMDSAAQNNNLDSVYLTYLRSNLNIYAADLKAAYAGTTDAGLKKILKEAYASVQVLMATSPLNASS